MEFLPLLDARARKGVFVQVDFPGRFGRQPHRVEVTGMLRPMREFLARELRPVNYSSSGILSVSGDSSCALVSLLSTTSVISLADVPAADATSDVHLGS